MVPRRAVSFLSLRSFSSGGGAALAVARRGRPSLRGPLLLGGSLGAASLLQIYGHSQAALEAPFRAGVSEGERCWIYTPSPRFWRAGPR
jgi:hypothetical protein